MNKELNLKKYEDKLEECMNRDCHEGEFNLFGNNIVIFTKEPDYENSDPFEYNGEGMKCAFVNTEYWSGWYEQDLGYDLYEVMKDVTKYVLDKHPVTLNITGTLDEDFCNSHSKQELINLLKESLEKKLSEYVIQADSLNISLNKKSKTFTGTFIVTWFGCEEYFLNNNTIIYSDNYQAEISCLDQDIKDYFNNAFNYSISL